MYVSTCDCHMCMHACLGCLITAICTRILLLRAEPISLTSEGSLILAQSSDIKLKRMFEELITSHSSEKVTKELVNIVTYYCMHNFHLTVRR